MEILERNVEKILAVLSLLAISLIFVYIFKNSDASIINWDEEKVNLNINDKVYENLYIDKINVPPVKAGDVVTITKKDFKLSDNNENLVFRTYGSTIDVFLSGENIYSYGEDLYREGKTLGRGYHIVKLRSLGDKTSDLVIKQRIVEDMSYRWVDFFKFTSSNNIWHEILINNVFGIVSGIFLFSLGAFGNLVYVVLFLITKKNNLHLSYSFATMFFIGLWNCTTSGIIQAITGNYEIISFLEYFSIYATFVMYLFLVALIKKKSGKTKAIDIVKLLSLLILIGATALHLSGTLCISKTIMLFRNYALIVLLVLFYTLYIYYKNQKKYENVLLIGNCISFALIVVHIIIHNFNLTEIMDITNDNLITIAVLVMIIIPLFLYLLELDEIEKYEMQIRVLKSLAYIDKLTGLGNRTSGIAYIMDLIKNGFDYYIVMFDLNNLKEVNDHLGHDKGDEMLVNFANCLNSSFSDDYCKKIRYGGDEFIVVVQFDKVEDINDNIKELFRVIDEVNRDGEKGYSLSVSYGIASSKEFATTGYENVVKLADERMYSYKSEVKNQICET